MSQNSTIEVIGAGNGRTGTSSLKRALEILGYDPCYHFSEVVVNGHYDFWIRVSKGEKCDFNEVFRCDKKVYKASVDFPSSLYWKEQLQQFPNAKVILTIRDPEAWYKSTCDTLLRLNPGSPFCSLGTKVVIHLVGGFRDLLHQLYEHDYIRGDWSKENFIKVFNENNARVIAECPGKQLLVFEAHQGWEPLCTFLEKPVPNTPFPHVNDTKELQNTVAVINAVGYAILATPVVVVGFLARYASQTDDKTAVVKATLSVGAALAAASVSAAWWYRARAAAHGHGSGSS